MGNAVLILDTSVLCCLFDVAGKNTCGPVADRWDKVRVEAAIAGNAGAVLVLPLAAIIETGNHITQCGNRVFETARQFGERLIDIANGTVPWAAFSEQSGLWSSGELIRIAQEWPALAQAGTSMGDLTIKDVAEYYAKAGFAVQILTADAGLKAYEPKSKLQIPRRRR